MLAVLLGGFSLGQAAPVFETFNKGCVAGAQIFRVIDRVPPIDPESDEGQTLPDEVRAIAHSEIRALSCSSSAFPCGARCALLLFR